MTHPQIDRKLVGWRATYEDGSIFDSSYVQWVDLPKIGIQILEKFYVLGDKNWREIQSGHDVYCPFNMFDNPYVSNFTDWVKWGTYIPDDVFHRLYDMIKFDQSMVAIIVE